MSLLRFINAVRKHWWTLMSCAAFTFLGMWVLYANKSNGWTFQSTLGLAAFCLFWGCFLAWQDEEKKVKELKIKVQTLEAAMLVPPVQNIYFPAPSIPSKPEPPKHNVQCLGIKVEDSFVTICFQNTPIPRQSIADFPNARLRVEHRLETTGEEWVTIFPARWISDNQDKVSVGITPLWAFLASYYEADRKWKASISLENAPNDFSWNDRVHGIALPTATLLVTATLIGEGNISLAPIRGILTLGEGGKASWILEDKENCKTQTIR
jgi:hypothetical protein